MKGGARLRAAAAGALLVASAAAPAQAPRGAIVFGENEARRAVAADAGRAVQVALPAHAGTGYVWRAEAGAGLAVAGPEEARAAPAAGPATGYRTLSIFQVTPLRAGAFSVRFVLARPWEKTTAREARLDITAR